MPMPTHMTLEGENQGEIKGSCDMEGREDSILVYQVDHTIHIPRDPQSGQPSGKRVHGPFTIVKEYDKASPKLYQALATGERMKNVTIKYFRIDPTGVEEHYFTHVFETAIIVNMRAYYPLTFVNESEPFRHMEEVSFTYDKVKWTWEPDGIESEDSWKKPIS